MDIFCNFQIQFAPHLVPTVIMELQVLILASIVIRNVLNVQGQIIANAVPAPTETIYNRRLQLVCLHVLQQIIILTHQTISAQVVMLFASLVQGPIIISVLPAPVAIFCSLLRRLIHVHQHAQLGSTAIAQRMNVRHATLHVQHAQERHTNSVKAAPQEITFSQRLRTLSV